MGYSRASAHSKRASHCVVVLDEAIYLTHQVPTETVIPFHCVRSARIAMSNLCQRIIRRSSFAPSQLIVRAKHSQPHHAPSSPREPNPMAGILTARLGAAQVVTLNRPQALNSLDLTTVRSLGHALSLWAADPHVSFVVLKGAGGRAFCAGGDVKWLWESRRSPDQQNAFFDGEYSLDYNLAVNSASEQPHVALLDGAVMGGGVGISIHAAVRVATEHTVFAMPETSLGLFPDVGGSYFLPRLGSQVGCPNFGTFLALTGYRLKGADAVHAGVATHYMPRAELPKCEAALTSLLLSRSTDLQSRLSAIRDVVGAHATPLSAAPPFCLRPTELAFINSAFNPDGDVESILSAVTAAASAHEPLPVAIAALGALRRAAPTSLRVTLEQMRRGGASPLRSCYIMEKRMAIRFMARHDFYEGVRSVLVDKDNAPKWNPAELRDVGRANVAAYFEPLPPEQELRLP